MVTPANTSQGLSDADAAERLRSDGPNELPAAQPKSLLTIAAGVLREPMLLLLLAAGTVYLLLGDIEEALALVGSIVVIIGITLYQHTKTEKTLQALRDLSSPRALVVRNGQKKRIAGRDVVRGDVLLIAEGDRIAADALIVSEVNLAVEESLLTGESVPVRKTAWDGRSSMPRPGGDELPAVFSGTMAVKGHGVAIVESTGPRTEIGKLGLALKGIDLQSTTLEVETRRLVRVFALVSLVLCVAVAFFYSMTRGDWLSGILAGLALAISLVPEEFPVVLTVFLALGAWRISRKRVLTRRVPAIEMLGSATTLCVDKTGTLTMNRMVVREVKPASNHSRAEILRAAMLASGDDPFDPMEKALHEAAAESSTSAEGSTLIREYSLSRELLAMSRVISLANSDLYDVFAKGAPEAIAQLCGEPLAAITDAASEMAQRGLRVLGVAHTQVQAGELPESQTAFKLQFLGLVGLEDPVRPSVPAAIAECYRAGIRVVMITGDFPATARAIGRQIGLKNTEEVITGTEVASLSSDQLRERVRSVNVFARVLPEQKLGLVEAFKSGGDVVAMTGDGVNDAPALKAAHIGIAMGGRGTDVAREAASLVLLDDDFSSIVESIRLGRRIYDNLKKAMTYIFAVHVPIAGMSLLPVLFRLPLVLMPLHIVFLELVIDPACSTAFESEPEHSNLMNRPPRKPNARLFDTKMITSGLFQGFLLFAVTLSAFLIALYRGQGDLDARAISFTTLVLGNVALIWANRSRTQTIPELLFSRNLALWAVTIGTLTLLAAVLYLPWPRTLFQFSILHPNDLVLCVLLVMISVTWFEAGKVLLRRKSQKTSPSL
jgi:Ca2+-transporting ATPase